MSIIKPTLTANRCSYRRPKPCSHWSDTPTAATPSVAGVKFSLSPMGHRVRITS